MVMRRNRRLLLLALGLAGAVLVVRRLRTPSAPMAEQPVPTPVVEPRKSPLPADAEGYYVPGYPFTVNGFRFTGFSLRPEALVTFARTTVPCFEAQITAQNVRLRCDDPHVGTVTIDGKFLTRLASNPLHAAVATSVLTVARGRGGV